MSRSGGCFLGGLGNRLQVHVIDEDCDGKMQQSILAPQSLSTLTADSCLLCFATASGH